MTIKETNGRTHEPSLREITAQLDDLKELVIHMDRASRDVAQERDRRYEDRFKAQETAVGSALTAQKELTTSAFASSEKAITKAEGAQSSYNATHNDLNRKMDEQYKSMLPRPEADSRFGTHDAKLQELKEGVNGLRIELMREIGGLRESRSEGSGEKHGRVTQQEATKYLIGIIVIILIVIAFITGKGGI